MRYPFLLCFLVGIQTTCLAQIYLTSGTDTDRIKKACSLLQAYAPEIYEASVQHATLQIQLDRDGEPLASTNLIEIGEKKTYWILLGMGSVRERSPYHLAGVIYHESLHLLLAEERMRNGLPGGFYDQTKTQQRQEELRIYLLEIDLLTRMGTPPEEIQEIRDWMEPYKDPILSSSYRFINDSISSASIGMFRIKSRYPFS